MIWNWNWHFLWKIRMEWMSNSMISWRDQFKDLHTVIISTLTVYVSVYGCDLPRNIRPQITLSIFNLFWKLCPKFHFLNLCTEVELCWDQSIWRGKECQLFFSGRGWAPPDFKLMATAAMASPQVLFGWICQITWSFFEISFQVEKTLLVNLSGRLHFVKFS